MPPCSTGRLYRERPVSWRFSRSPTRAACGTFYLVPVKPGEAGAPIADAMEDPAFCIALTEQIRQGGILAGQLGTFHATPTEAFTEILPSRPQECTRIRGEQSNTSVTYDGRAILKLFRRFEVGLNPDFEITDFLTRLTAFRGTPRLAGSLAYEAPGRERAILAVLQEFIANEGDAWTGMQRRLAEYYAAASNGHGADEGGDPVFARTLAAADAREMVRLGALTGQLHMALASAPPGTPLAPELVAEEDVAAWLGAMEAFADRVLAALSAALPTLPESLRATAQGIVEEAPRLRDVLADVRLLTAGSVTKIRIHGDYHLGQVLTAGEGFVILDFEGEPVRPLAERRAKQCPLKDVAGMLRSFAYATQAALFRAGEASPEDAGLAGRLAPWAENWEEGVRRAFLAGYLAETWERGASFLPRDRETLEAVLRAYELDKAVYELEYEMQNRPAWVRIPLEGLRRAAAAAPKPKAAPAVAGAGPFHFVACLELREFVGVRAENERQLAELIEEVPLDSIYHHTHGLFLRHKFVAGAYPNDFATWAAIQVRDRVLGERLAMVDPSEFPNLQALREELVAVIDDHLRGLQFAPGVIAGEPFDFIQSRTVEIPTGIRVRSLQEFRDALLEVDVSAIYFHLVEARMRLGRGQNDFAAWLDELGEAELAAKVRTVDPYAGSLERTRTRLIQLCDEALAAGEGR